jgi:hypothetical protein
MRAKLLCSVLIAGVSSGLLVFCVGGDDQSQDASTKDVQTSDVTSEAPPAQGFTIALAPSHVTADPGDSNIAIAINVNRAASFTDDVAFTITPPAHVTATNAVDTGNAGTQSSFSISVDNSMPLGTAQLTVTASNPTKTFVQNATLDILVGTLANLGDAGTFTVPDWATSLTIKAWGAGGGASCPTCAGGNTSGVAQGGGGGFASGTVAVTPGAQLVILTGTGGAAGYITAADAGTCPGKFSGGGGGGFTGVQVKGGSYLVIAGGGGGTSYYSGNGGGGGGATGEGVFDVSDSGCSTSGGSQTSGGSSSSGCANMGEAGTSLQGGNGYTSCVGPYAAGGVPGGGSGGFGTILSNGGGGGGFFGGGGGGELSSTNFGHAAGGGSGHVASDAGTLVTASGPTTANTSDPDFAHCASATGSGGTTQVNNGVGGGGCVVIRYTKP